jgi:alpha-D-ribose 1-methylphosphonate 5-triphosphate synthase subunit PhnH
MIDLPGFADPTAGAQACFRAVLDAMSRPGTVHDAGTGLTPPAPLDAATAAVLLTLADADTPVFIAAKHQAVREWAGFHCGCPFAATPADASFVLAAELPDLGSLDAGSDEAPHASATALLQVRALGGGSAWRLDGPGLRQPASLLVDGLPGDFAAIWAANHALFPRGVDIILCAGGRLAALPRSLRITEG